MEPLQLLNLRSVAESISPRRGWGFSRMRDERDPVPWDYHERARRFLGATDRVLDTGTGGGERFLAFAASFATGLGIDASPEMVRTATENTVPELRGRVAFAVMDAEDLAIADASFDVVLNRHAPFAPWEVARVLRPGGCFVTQQIGRRNMQNIFAAFGWASSGAFWDAERKGSGKPARTTETAIASFTALGCAVVAYGTYDVGYYVRDLESLLFWLQSVPLPEPFDIDRHERLVRSLIEDNQSPRGFVTNEARDILIVRKR